MNHMSPEVRTLIRDLPDSQIRTIAQDFIGDDSVIPLWFGESDEQTPDFVKQAAKDALDDGETFYAPNSGIAPLRQEICRYMQRVYGRQFLTDRITVTASGMHAIMIAYQSIIDPGDNVLAVSPVWPNCVESAAIMGAEIREVPLNETDGKWSLDVQRLMDRADERTKCVFINSPGNPTGWMMSESERDALLGWARQRGIWIMSDDVYARLVYDRHHAPAIVEIAEPEDRVISINSFSKSWSMTGWRLGWITAPPSLELPLAKLNEYNIAGPTTFVQHGGIAALRDGDPYIEGLVERLKRRRDLVSQAMSRFGRVTFNTPDAAFYAFIGVEGMGDNMAFALKLRDEAKVGVVPGTAFGPAGEGYLRLCFASSEKMLSEAMDRMEPFLR